MEQEQRKQSGYLEGARVILPCRRIRDPQYLIPSRSPVSQSRNHHLVFFHHFWFQQYSRLRILIFSFISHCFLAVSCLRFTECSGLEVTYKDHPLLLYLVSQAGILPHLLDSQHLGIADSSAFQELVLEKWPALIDPSTFKSIFPVDLTRSLSSAGSY